MNVTINTLWQWLTFQYRMRLIVNEQSPKAKQSPFENWLDQPHLGSLSLWLSTRQCLFICLFKAVFSTFLTLPNLTLPNFTYCLSLNSHYFSFNSTIQHFLTSSIHIHLFSLSSYFLTSAKKSLSPPFLHFIENHPPVPPTVVTEMVSSLHSAETSYRKNMFIFSDIPLFQIFLFLTAP